MTGVGKAELTACPGCRVEQGRVAVADQGRAQVFHSVQYPRRRVALRGVGAHRHAELAHDGSGEDVVAHDDPDDQSETLIRQLEGVEPVAPTLAPGWAGM